MLPRTPDYDEYLKSPQWEHLRARVLKRFRERCALCNNGGHGIVFHVHHRTYERLGCEDIEDLTLLCKRCHDLFHVHGFLRPSPGFSPLGNHSHGDLRTDMKSFTGLTYEEALRLNSASGTDGGD